ncbi:hypothetical protein CORC01_07947 [Colletotrichum orchidophilum]|uniref:Uncharacterized protein n=1 Tax=Colletotrichum orchidophilum TaxID=1209926 RepID=A0A1G4B5W4_9PEZI|nr:uncharacterized protein CORC01_07947 [Colletotrichum orchidophilum]OHE96801.1 hypothetical protein CORC01_07947 [Colletotrichum orchidophilum]
MTGENSGRLVGIGPNSDANARRPGFPEFALVNRESFHAFLQAYIRIDKNPLDPIVYHPSLYSSSNESNKLYSNAAALLPNVDCIYLNPRTDEISLGYKTELPDPNWVPGFIQADLGTAINIQIKMARIVTEDFEDNCRYDYPGQLFESLDNEPVASIDMDACKYRNADQVTVIVPGFDKDVWGSLSGAVSFVAHYNVDTKRVFVDDDYDGADDKALETFRLEVPHKSDGTSEASDETNGESDETTLLAVRIVFHRGSDENYHGHELKPIVAADLADLGDMSYPGRMERVYWEIAAQAVNHRLF